MSSVTLYRKYRPQSFAEIVNQDHVKTTLQQEILTGKLPHAFLFYGPRGIGKTTTARVLAKTLNCKKRKKDSAEPCNDCESCESITEGKSLNLVEVDAASQTGVDNVRENIIANARVAVNSDEHKIFIIDEVHMLSTSSFNALLKTLEEPPERVVFVLATTEIHKIPETIISRCQRFDLHPVAAPILLEHLKSIAKKEEREVEEAVLSAIVKKSAGHVRDAISLLGQLFSMPGKVTAEAASFILPVSNIENVVEFFGHVSANKPAEAMLFLDQQEKAGVRPYHFCQDLIDFAHKMMLFRVGSHPDIFMGEVGDDLMPAVTEITNRYSPKQLLHVIDVLIKRRRQLKDYNQGRLPLELAVIELVGQGAVDSAQSTPVSTPPPVVNKPKPETPKVTKKKEEPVNKIEEPKAEKPKVESVEKTPVLNDQSDLEQASFSEVQSVWQEFAKSLDHEHHSLCIFLKTAEHRETNKGSIELAFPFQMHCDHVKRSMVDMIDKIKELLPDKKVQFILSVDPDVKPHIKSDVDEPRPEEKKALSEELNQLADAFGGSVVD